MNEMTGKEIVNLIDKLRDKGMNDTEIIDVIKYIELTKPEDQVNEKRAD